MLSFIDCIGPNGLQARDLMPCLCRYFAVIFAIFTKVCRVFYHFCRDFLLSLVLSYCVWYCQKLKQLSVLCKTEDHDSFTEYNHSTRMIVEYHSYLLCLLLPLTVVDI